MSSMSRVIAQDGQDASIGDGLVASAEAAYRACNLCGSDKRRLRYAIDGFHIVECLKCDLNYVAERVSEAELSCYYGEAYYNGGQANGYADYLAGREAKKAHYRTLLPSIRHHLHTKSVRALDVGCAAGFFLEVAQETGWNARGIELSPYMSRYAREQRGLEVLTGSLESLDLPKESFNLITMWDVIEHLADPAAALRRAYDLMTANGIIAIATGDISGATARIYRRRWDLLAPPGHLFYFSRKTLFEMLRRARFQPLAWQSDGAFLVNGESRGKLRSAVNRLHRSRYVNAALRRLKLGSIMTVYARKCGIN
jgi:2-polyprenyl-3-methyl-5-hydroxy-6-metoxy-1,4-benzoquinol methylase